MDDTLVRKLHDRATHGEVLTPAEQAPLNEWYAEQDTLEGTLLTSSQPSETDPLIQVRIQTEAALTQVQIEVQRLQALAEENDVLRRENAALTHRLTQSTVSQAA